MKVTIYIFFVMVFGALFLAPKLPKPYPPKEVLEQKESIIFKERQIEHLINKIEYELAKDSLEIKQVK